MRRGTLLVLALLFAGELWADAALWLPQPRHLRVYEVDLQRPDSPRLLGDRCAVEGRVRPYALSPKGEACVLLDQGLLVVDRAPDVRRVFELPNLASDRFAVGAKGEAVAVELWTERQRQLVVLDVTGPALRPVVLRTHAPGPGRKVVDFAWEAGGEALLVLEYGRGTSFVTRVPLRGQQVELFRRRCHGSRVVPSPLGRGRFLVPTTARWTALGTARHEDTRVAALDGFGVSQLSWGPGGSRVLFLAARGGERTGVFLADLSTGKVQRLSERIDTHTLAFSPDGRHVYWASSPLSGRLTGGSTLRLASTRTPLQPITVHAGDDPQAQLGGASMDARGTRLAYTVGGELYLYAVQAARSSRVTRLSVPWAARITPEVADERPAWPFRPILGRFRDPLLFPPRDPARSSAADRPRPDLAATHPAWRGKGRVVVALVLDCDHPKLR